MLKDEGGGLRLNHPCGNILYFVIAITLGMWVSVHASYLNRLELNTLLFQQTMQTKFAFRQMRFNLLRARPWNVIGALLDLSVTQMFLPLQSAPLL
jgi:hypothetical protein